VVVLPRVLEHRILALATHVLGDGVGGISAFGVGVRGDVETLGIRRVRRKVTTAT
jgi:hypothetical protein